MFTLVHHHFLLNRITRCFLSRSLSLSLCTYAIDEQAYRPSINLIRQICCWENRRMVGYYCFVKNTSLRWWTCRQISIFLARLLFLFFLEYFFSLLSLARALPFSSTAAITIPLTLLDACTHSFFLSRPPFLFLCSMLMTYAHTRSSPSFSLSIDVYSHHAILYYGRC